MVLKPDKENVKPFLKTLGVSSLSLSLSLYPFSSPMLSRLLPRPLPLRFLTLTFISSSHHHPSASTFLLRPPLQAPRPPPSDPAPISLFHSPRFYSSNRGGAGSGDGGGDWKFSPDSDEIESVFGEDVGNLAGIANGADDAFGSSENDDQGMDVKGGDVWSKDAAAEVKQEGVNGDIFGDIDREFSSKKEEGAGGGLDDEWETAEGYKPWRLGEGDEKGDAFFVVGEEGELGIEGIEDIAADEIEKDDEQKQLEKKEEELLATLKGKRL